MNNKEEDVSNQSLSRVIKDQTFKEPVKLESYQQILISEQPYLLQKADYYILTIENNKFNKRYKVSK